MNRIIALLAVVSVLSVGVISLADDSVVPAILDGVSLYRDASSIAYTTNTYFTQSATLRITNAVCYSTADLGTNSVVQGLDGVTVEVAASTSSTVTGSWASATVDVASNGTFWATISALPASGSVYWQCRLTDASTNIYYYRMQILHAEAHL